MKNTRLFLYVSLFALSGCGGDKKEEMRTSETLPEEGKAFFSKQTVFFGTNRKLTTSNEAANRFGNEESTDGLHLGTCEVSIPKNHKEGKLEAPAWWRFEFTEDPEKHIVLLATNPLEPSAFYGRVQEKVGESASRKAFIFVHGYRTTFTDAARRTAQIAHDLDFKGAPIFFSWPSKGALAAYTVDETTSAQSRPALKEFLGEMIRKTGAEEIYLVGHSMGSKVLTEIFPELFAELGSDFRLRIKEIILAAPDIDATVFKREIAPKMLETKVPLTIYASDQDFALVASKTVHGYSRVGHSAERAALPGIEAIDASAVSTDFINHALFAEQPSIINDIRKIIELRHRADHRDTVELVPVAARYWKIIPKKAL